MSQAINNGRRADVAFGNFRGRAGVVEHAGVMQVAFAGDLRSLAGVAEGTIDGVPYRVASIAASDPKAGGVKGMVRLVVEPQQPQNGASE